jgi:hypothetical protein
VTEEQTGVYNEEEKRYRSTVTRTVGETLVSPTHLARAAGPDMAGLRAQEATIKSKTAAGGGAAKRKAVVCTVAPPETVVHFVTVAAPPATVAVAAGTAAVAAKDSPVRRGLPGHHNRFSYATATTAAVQEKQKECKPKTAVKCAVYTVARRLRKKNNAKRQQAIELLKSQRQLVGVSELDDDDTDTAGAITGGSSGTKSAKFGSTASKHSADLEKGCAGAATTAVKSSKTHSDITDVYLFKSPWLFTQGLSLVLLLINIYSALLLANYAIVVSARA